MPSFEEEVKRALWEGTMTDPKALEALVEGEVAASYDDLFQLILRKIGVLEALTIRIASEIDDLHGPA